MTAKFIYQKFKNKIPSLIFTSIIIIAAGWTASAQTAGTAALSGTVTDQSEASVAGAQIKVKNETTGEERTVISTESGSYVIPLLPPGSYRVEVTANNFKMVVFQNVKLNVTETQTLNIKLEIGVVTETVTVESDTEVVQTETSALGRVVDAEVVSSLPLVTRNFTQIVGLSAGVVAPVTNATELGRGGGGLSFTGGFSAHGSRNYDNNFELNGVGSNDLFASGGNSGGVAIPNPDTIEQFKVQTGQYDASFGRNSGANVNIVTKGGSKDFHGSLFEFFRNDKLNANSFFFNRNGVPRGVLKQNQFGGTIGGPILKEKLLFFASYQGTRQRNGITLGCSSTYSGPPLTNDRSAAALGALFAGRTGALGGTAITANGSNINPVALRILQLQLPNGQYLIPTPQRINTALPFAQQGQYVQQGVCSFDENQYMGNFDYLQSEKSKFTSRFFLAESKGVVPFTNNSPIFYPTNNKNTFANYSLGNTYIFSPTLFNEASFGFHLIHASSTPQAPFTWSQVGATSPEPGNSLPSITITGFGSSIFTPRVDIPQRYFEVRDTLTWVRGNHTLRFGGGFEKAAMDFNDFAINGTTLFLSFPDFLLGLPGGPTASGGNGTPFSNVFASVDLVGLTDRKYRSFNGWLFAQDDFKVLKNLTLNLGFRYERATPVADALGRNAGIDPSLINPNPSAAGSLTGFLVPSNFDGAIPAGVTQINNEFGIKGTGQNLFEPRLGFAWQVLPNSSRLVLRGGYGIYHTRLVGQQYLQLVTSPPFSQIRQVQSVGNAAASLANPFQAAPTFPFFPAYSPTTQLTPRFLAQDYQPARTQQYSLNVQTELAKDLLFELGYVGAQATHLIRTRSINQAQLASVANPIRGVTTNTLANIALRVPYQGFSSNGFQVVESAGSSWYNAMEATLSKRFSHGFQFIAAYTFSRLLDTDGGNATATSGGNVLTLGNQNDEQSRTGPSDFNREHRLVLSYVYQIPNFLKTEKGLGLLTSGWSIAGVTTVQSGQRLTITATNSNNAFGITTDHVQLAAGCTHEQLVTSGSITSNIDNYFNRSCFTAFPIIEGTVTNFGNSGAGIVKGPGQNNTDLSLSKRTSINWLREGANVEFRAEFFNAFNTPQFANPDTNFSSATFGKITNTSVNPRIIQFALKFNF
ncbi:MAG TPA: TonB-dependent receptor [Pyrinomonadaceae bacterium]|jgi:hypothetical protein